MANHKSRVILIGAGPTALSALQSLIDACQVLVLFRDAEPVDPVIRVAAENGVPVTRNMSLSAIETAVREHKPDCVVISSYNRIVSRSVLQLCPFVNVHYSELPKYRGRANVNWAIINQEPSTGISIHAVAPGLDSGNIMFQQSIAIGSRDTVTDMYDRLNEIQREQLGRTVCEYLAGSKGFSQVEQQATYGCTRTAADGQIDWSSSTQKVDALIRALQPPYEWAYTFLRCRRVGIVAAEPVPNAPVYAGRIPGRVVLVSKTSGSVDVMTGDGILRVHRLYMGAGESQAAATVITSTQDTLGLKTEDLLSRLEEVQNTIRGLQAQLTHKGQFPDSSERGNSCYPEPIAF